MAVTPQDYPRINDENDKENGCLDTSQLVAHKRKIPADELKLAVLSAIENANSKSSRKSIAIPELATEEEILGIYDKVGKDLFRYFKRYCGDPASTAHQLEGKYYRDVAMEQFLLRNVQKGRMNSGWRYQFLLLDCAIRSRRFKSVSDLGVAEADLNVVVEYKDSTRIPLSLYVSVKNRKNTLGGQDWPKAIKALEAVAKTDRNRTGAYCCVFAITMDRGQRYIKTIRKTGQPHSFNTEIWLSDFLWPFFANYTYEEIMSFVLDVLLASQEAEILSTQIEIPDGVLVSFGRACFDAGLLDSDGHFDDPHKVVKFFCN
ncbi:MAG: hypothetical protein U9Q82_05700 [Chloroflexota bacterium]|nr:hypothetical protein [Chloroflexota bacterium]